jgi:hypothetical protein
MRPALADAFEPSAVLLTEDSAVASSMRVDGAAAPKPVHREFGGRPMRIRPPEPHVAGVYAVTTDAFTRRAV